MRGMVGRVPICMLVAHKQPAFGANLMASGAALRRANAEIGGLLTGPGIVKTIRKSASAEDAADLRPVGGIVLIVRRLLMPLTLTAWPRSAGARRKARFRRRCPARAPRRARLAISAGERRGARRCRRAAPSPFSSTGGAPVRLARSARPRASAAGRRSRPDDCMKNFAPLRQDAEKRGKMIKAAASARRRRRKPAI